MRPKGVSLCETIMTDLNFKEVKGENLKGH